MKNNRVKNKKKKPLHFKKISMSIKNEQLPSEI